MKGEGDLLLPCVQTSVYCTQMFVYINWNPTMAVLSYNSHCEPPAGAVCQDNLKAKAKPKRNNESYFLVLDRKKEHFAEIYSKYTFIKVWLF